MKFTVLVVLLGVLALCSADSHYISVATLLKGENHARVTQTLTLGSATHEPFDCYTGYGSYLRKVESSEEPPSDCYDSDRRLIKIIRVTQLNTQNNYKMAAVEYPRTLFNYELDLFLKEFQGNFTVADYSIGDFKNEYLEAVDVKLTFDPPQREGDAFKYEFAQGEITAVGTLALKNFAISMASLDISEKPTQTNVELRSGEVHLDVIYTGSNNSHIQNNKIQDQCETLQLSLLGVNVTRPFLYGVIKKGLSDMTEIIVRKVLPIKVMQMSSFRFQQAMTKVAQENHFHLCKYF